MKKFYVIAAMAVATLVAQAQEKLNLSTYNGTNIEKFDGKVCDITTNRLIFKGWNTIALPFAMSESELNENFGFDCKLEKLVGVEANGNAIQLNFQDCKQDGLEANTPYILYYTGETTSKKIVVSALVADKNAALTFDVNGLNETVSMVGVQKHLDGDGLYGILAVDNSEPKFVKVSAASNGFYATRCYVKLSSGNNRTLIAKHFAADDPMAIDAVVASDKIVDVYNTAGVKVATHIRASEINKLQPNIYVVNGQKISVK
jgi:hypothetical protein